MNQRIVKHKKYNPAFLSDEDLIESFVVRHVDLELILQTVRENVTESNKHIMVIGPRGIGKTMLVLRVAVEVRRVTDLCDKWYPLVFAEESYQVSTPGEFWLEALFHLGQQTGDEHWKLSYKELMEEHDENRLRERALAQLMDFADGEGKRILMIVENFNMLLGGQISDDDAWKIRHTLLNEPRIMLLASATRRFDEIDSLDKAMFELFRPQELKPLDEARCRKVWASVSGEELSEKRIRPIRILTGGNPRLLTIIASFAVRLSFKELMQDLIQLVDDHTEYFKSHLDRLAPIERKVYLSLAELWDPSTASEVSKAARLNVSKTSALLGRLMERGAVTIWREKGRKKWYQVAERMYNIYYLMRRRGAPSRRVRAVVRFMVLFYGPEEIVHITQRIAEEACELEAEFRKDHYVFYEQICESVLDESVRDKIRFETPSRFFDMTDTPSSIRCLSEREKKGKVELARGKGEEFSKLIERAEALSETAGGLDEAEHLYREATEIGKDNAKSWLTLGKFLEKKLENYTDAEEAYKRAIELEPKSAKGWTALGSLMCSHLKRYDEAEELLRKAVKIKPDYAFAWATLGMLLHRYLRRYEEAEEAYRKAIEVEPNDAWDWANLGWVLQDGLQRHDEAEMAYRKAIEVEPDNHWAWERLGVLLHKQFRRYDEAEEAYREAIKLGPNCDVVWANLGQLLHEHLDHSDEAEEAYRKAIEIRPESAWIWNHLGMLLDEYTNRHEEAEDSFRKAIELKPDYTEAKINMGVNLHIQKDYKEAEDAFRKVIDLEPENPCVWVYYGKLLSDLPGRYEEAEEAYCKALEKHPECAWGWSKLGELLHDKLERYEEAEKTYHKAIELNPNSDLAWMRLIKLLLSNLKRPTEAFDLAKGCIEKTPENAVLLNSFAWNFYKYGKGDYLEKAEEWAHRAVETKPDNGHYQHTLATILATLGKKREALELVQRYLADREAVEATIEDAISLFVELAAHDYAKEALGILKDSASAKILEPLVVGLQLFVGEEVNTAVEIMEIGKDVVKRIQKRREKNSD